MDNEQPYKPRDIQIRTFEFAKRIVRLVDRMQRSVAGIEVGRQLLRAGSSVGANVREADAAETHKDFVHKIMIAEKEAKESHYWLELVNETLLSNDSEVHLLLDEANQLGRILYAIGRRKKNTN
jgi:four helix bundle protein